MDIRQIERLMRTMQQHGVTKLELSEGEMSLSLSREPAAVTLVAPEAAEAHLPETVSEPPAQAAVVTGKEILSPMVGTFHHRSKDPVKVGSRLKKGEVFCVIEAMKLMNDIAMEEDGEITFIALKEGDMVEFGQVIAQYR